MAAVEIADDLKRLVDRLNTLRSGTPVTTPEYERITKCHRSASDLLEKAIAVSIDDADRDYLTFTAQVKEAIAAINDAKARGRITDTTNAIEAAARAVDMAAKIIAKLY